MRVLKSSARADQNFQALEARFWFFVCIRVGNFVDGEILRVQQEVFQPDLPPPLRLVFAVLAE